MSNSMMQGGEADARRHHDANTAHHRHDMVQATHLLLQQKIGCLPEVDNSTRVGVVTDIDCLRAFLMSQEGASGSPKEAAPR
jgi:hypothetical protein